MERLPLQLGAHTIHLRRAVTGNRTPIVLVHGIGVSGDYYVAFAKIMSKYYDVYIIDLPGYGKTPKPKRPLTIKQLSSVVLDFVQSLTLRDVVIIGQSMGCQIIAHTITDRPSLFRKAILLAPTCNINERNIFTQAWRLSQDSFVEPPSANAIVFGNYMRMGIRRYLITSRYMVDDAIENTLNHTTVRLLLVRGTKDRIVPKDWIDYLGNVIPRSKSAEISDAPHLLQYQQPKNLAKICKKFIEE